MLQFCICDLLVQTKGVGLFSIRCLIFHCNFVVLPTTKQKNTFECNFAVYFQQQKNKNTHQFHGVWIECNCSNCQVFYLPCTFFLNCTLKSEAFSCSRYIFSSNYRKHTCKGSRTIKMIQT